MSNYIHPITIEAAKEVGLNLRPEDRREVEEGYGTDPYEWLLFKAQEGSCIYFSSPSGKAAGMAGVDQGGLIWMLCTPVIFENKSLFIRQAKRFIESREEPLLWNIIDKRNTVHLKLLQFLGFKFLREFKHGPNQLTFIEFCRISNSVTNRRPSTRSI